MMKEKPAQPFPWKAFGLFITPIFLINLMLPAHPQSSLDIAIDQFLDDQLFGVIGFWSSLFPFSSKVTANYVAIFGPLLAATSTYCAFTKKFESEKFTQLTLRRYLGVLAGGVMLPALFVWFFYLTSTDLGIGKGRYGNLFGSNVIFVSIPNVTLSLFTFVVAPFVVHRCLYYIPRHLIEKWLATR